LLVPILKKKNLPIGYLDKAFSSLNWISIGNKENQSIFFHYLNTLAIDPTFESLIDDPTTFNASASTFAPIYHEMWHKYFYDLERKNDPNYSDILNWGIKIFPNVSENNIRELIDETTAFTIERLISAQDIYQSAKTRWFTPFNDQDPKTPLRLKTTLDQLKSSFNDPIEGYYHAPNASNADDITMVKSTINAGYLSYLRKQILEDFELPPTTEEELKTNLQK
jgi:hypothetical protein